MIGTDGGLLPAPYRTSRIMLSPGERADVIVSMTAGERVVLRSYPPDLGADRGITRLAGGADTLDVLELRAAADLTPSAPVPARLVDLPVLDPASAAATRTFELSGRTINGRKMDMRRIDEMVRRDTTEIWEVTNHHNQPHSFHVHDVQFQILTIGGARPPA
jgi:FtsP/CotA-like multicopper oxidase with cupredoxin domain